MATESALIIGSGGREHALATALRRTHPELQLYCFPGNPGMISDGCIPVDPPAMGWEELSKWASEKRIDLTVVGPEIPLVEGIADIFEERGLAVFGPSRLAARIEGSKVFAKDLMRKYAIPTAAYTTVHTREQALDHLRKAGAPLVVKVSGLAAGKGAIVCSTEEEVKTAIEEIFVKNAFGDAGSSVVMEEMMVGEEASVFVLTDGVSRFILPVAQDHKRIGDGDTGPNTGGMGAYAPAPLVDAPMLSRIDQEIIVPTLEAMRQEGCPYRGLLYAGIMVTAQGPKVVEFNCRFGDPETQAVLPLIEGDLFVALKACALGGLAQVSLRVRDESCASVVLASGGYPATYPKGKVITGIEDAVGAGVDVYHAGTARTDTGQLVTAGGRVLAVSACAGSLKSAIQKVYDVIPAIHFEGMVMRKDIGAKGLARTTVK